MRPPRRPSLSVSLTPCPGRTGVPSVDGRAGRPSQASLPAHPGFSLIEIMVAISIIIVLTALGLVAFHKVSDSSSKQQTQMLMKELLGLEGEYFAATGQRVNHYSRSGAAYTDTQTPYDWTANTAYTDDVFTLDASGTTCTYTYGKPGYDTWTNGAAQPSFVGKVLDKVPNADAVQKGSIEAFVAATMQLPACAKMYNRLRTDQTLRDGIDSTTPVRAADGFLEIVDPWGTRLRYYLKTTKNGAPDYDANYSTDALAVYHKIVGPDGQSVYSKVPFFVSAGPDGRFGWDDPTDASQNDYGTGVFNYTAQEQAKYAADNIYSFNLE